MKKSKDWEKDMEDAAEEESSREKAGGGAGNMLSIKGRKFTFGGEKIGRELKCIVVDSVYLNTWYKEKYDDDKRGSIPTCFALSAKEDALKPHDNSPKKQSKTCATCPKNEWGSGGKKRKACRQGRKLAIMDYEDAGTAEAIAEAGIAILSLPPTSTRNWGTFVKDVKAKYNYPFWAVAVKMTFDEDTDYPVLEFELATKLKQSKIEALQERREEIRELLMKPFEAQDDDDADDDDEDEDEKPGKKKAPAKSKKKSKVEDDDEDDDLDEDEDEDEKPAKKKGKKSKDDDDEDEEEDEKPAKKKKAKKELEEEDLDEEDEDEDEKPAKKGKKPAKKSKEDDDEDEDEDADEEDEDEEEDDESEESDDDDADDDDEEGEKPVRKKKKGSRFGK